MCDAVIISASGAETKSFHIDQVNSMAADVLAPCITRSSVNEQLSMQDKKICCSIMNNSNYLCHLSVY